MDNEVFKETLLKLFETKQYANQKTCKELIKKLNLVLNKQQSILGISGITIRNIYIFTLNRHYLTN